MCMYSCKEAAFRGTMKGWSAGRIFSGRKELCGVWCVYENGFSTTPAYLFPIQKYCFPITEQTSRVQAESRALKCKAAQLKEEQYENSGIVWICQRIPNVQLQREIHRNPNSLRLNEHWLNTHWFINEIILQRHYKVRVISMPIRNTLWGGIRPFSDILWCMALAFLRSRWNDNGVEEALSGSTASYHAQSSSHSVKSAHFCCY